jgi:hypothetical protein
MIPKYDWLVIRNRWTDKVVEELRDRSELDDMPKGWYIAFGEQMIDELNELLVKANFTDKYRILQIKEKYGQLRWYENGIPKSIFNEYNELMKKYTRLSEVTCIVCGDKGEIICNNGWYMPLCKKCIKGEKDESS